MEPRRGASFTTITMTRSPAESSLNPRPLIHVNDVDDEIHDYDREGKKERKMNEKKEEGYPRNKVANRSNLFFPTPPPSTTEFLLLSCSEARPSLPSILWKLWNIPSLISWDFARKASREKNARETQGQKEREEGGGPACPSAPRQTQEEIRFCFHPVIFSRASTPPRFVFVNDATSLREAHFGRYRNRIKILFVSRSRSVKIQREK